MMVGSNVATERISVLNFVTEEHPSLTMHVNAVRWHCLSSTSYLLNHTVSGSRLLVVEMGTICVGRYVRKESMPCSHKSATY
jgi:hypothetical protein